MRPLWVSFFVFFLMLSSTYVTYQEWLKNESDLSFSEEIAYSHSSRVIELSAPSGKRLVPMGAVLGINDVNQVEYRFSVRVKNDHVVTVKAVNVVFQTSDTVYEDVESLLVFDYHINQIDQENAEVTVVVSLAMPSNEVEKTIIQGSNASFELMINQVPID